MEGLLQAYEKSSKVIESCESYMQIKAAKKYAASFFRNYSKQSNKGIRIADSTVIAMYKELQMKLENKEKNLYSKLDN